MSDEADEWIRSNLRMYAWMLGFLSLFVYVASVISMDNAHIAYVGGVLGGQAIGLFWLLIYTE